MYGISDAKNEILKLNTSAQGKIGSMFVGDGKARLEVDEGCHDGACGNLKTRVDDEVEIEAIVVADESIMPISNVETSAHVVER